MAPTATDIPSKYDVIIDGQGYRFWDASPDGTKAEYGFTPTFVPRSNTQGDFGDNFQDFWLTATQRDWSLGFSQKFYRPDDKESVRRFWDSTGIDVSIPGQASLQYDKETVTFAAVVSGAESFSGGDFYVMSETNLYSVDATGAITDHGAHGCAGVAARRGLEYGGDQLYLVEIGGNIRSWDGASFATFDAAAGVEEMAYLNNTLFASSGSELLRYSTAGVQSSIFQWKGGAGGILGNAVMRIIDFGSKLLMFNNISNIYSLWLYDGAGVTKIAEFPFGYIAEDMVVVNGVVYITLKEPANGETQLWFYANGTLGLLWGPATRPGTAAGTGQSAVCSWEDGVVFVDARRNRVMQYRGSTGCISELFAFTGTVAFASKSLAASFGGILLTEAGSVTAAKWPGSTAGSYFRNSTGSITTSLFDFDSSLTKIMRGIKVEFDSATDGNGGSVDIAYRVGDVDGSYTSLQTGAVSSSEYTLSNITGRSISVKVTLNKGTSTLGPVLKRVAVRAVPQQATFRRESYVLDLSGRDGHGSLRLRDNQTFHPKDGMQMAADLRTAAVSSTPITIIDRFGSFTGIIEAEKLRIVEVRPEEFYAVVGVREI